MLTKLALPSALLAVAILFLPQRQAFALPPGGSDALTVNAQASLTSRLGQETIFLSGTATITRSDPYDSGGHEQVDLELTSLSLTGNSVTGPVAISQSASTPSTGTLRSDQAGQSWPATPELDLYLEIEAPASPSPTISLHNSNPIHVQTMYDGSPLSVSSWPPTAVPWEADLSTCVPLNPLLPKQVCLTALSFALSGSLPGGGVGGIAELPNLTGSGPGGGLPLAVAIAAILGLVALAWPLRRVLAR